jgi:hypothetical protein
VADSRAGATIKPVLTFDSGSDREHDRPVFC